MPWLLDGTPASISVAIRSGSELSDGDVHGWIGMTFADAKVASVAFDLRSKEARQATTIVGDEASMTVERNRITIDGEDVTFDLSAGAFELQMREFVSSIQE